MRYVHFTEMAYIWGMNGSLYFQLDMVFPFQQMNLQTSFHEAAN